jgi:hypothetical protein
VVPPEPAKGPRGRPGKPDPPRCSLSEARAAEAGPGQAKLAAVVRPERVRAAEVRPGKPDRRSVPPEQASEAGCTTPVCRPAPPACAAVSLMRPPAGRARETFGAMSAFPGPARSLLGFAGLCPPR